ncbi:MAG: helix-turn-helix domain-containing protein [Spirochaetota bacterium]
MLYLWIFLGGSLAWLISLSQLLRPKHLKNRVLALLLFCVGFWQLYLGLLYSNQILSYAYLFNSMGPFVFFTGPLFYLYFTIVIQESYRFKKVWYLHFLPGIIAGVVLFGLNIQLGDEVVQTLQEIRKKGKVGPIKSLLLLAITIDSVYVILLMRKFPNIWSKEYFKDKRMVHVLLFIIMTLVVSFLFLLCVLVESELLGKICTAGVTFIIVYIYMIYQKYPEMLSFLKEETEKKKYEKTQIANLDLGSVKGKLHKFMEEEKVFCDEDISLKSLADMLDITPHQLSEFLNIHMQTNFKSYVKTFRIAEAQKILVEEPGRTTLSVGFAVGFNSNSAFHSAFRKATGQTPKQYRNSASADRQ